MVQNPFIAVIHNRFRQALAEIGHHRWIKWRRILECFQADEELQVWVFLDLLDQFFVREPEISLDDQCAQCYAEGLCRCANALAELRRLLILQLIPRY